MSLGFGLENIDDMIQGGIPPVFSDHDMKIMEKKAETNRYWMKAYDFVHSYRRNATPWEIMTKTQRDWLWKIKDSLR